MRTIDDRERSDIPQPVSCRNLSPREEEPIWQIVDIWLASEPFRELMYHPRVTTAWRS